MPCYHPLPAWHKPGQTPLLRVNNPTEYNQIQLPCGKCIGCNKAHALTWAFRCTMENQLHLHAAFLTLTYAEKYCPPTLSRTHLSKYIRSVRKRSATTIRYFGCGEYGPQTQRPHYHAILWGLPLNKENRELLDKAWPYGYVTTKQLTPRRIAYTAGYTAKKWKKRDHLDEGQRVSSDGELYTYQPEFLQMSRNPGIGGHARQYTQSWQLYAIHNGIKIPVPRYYHAAWKALATEEEIENNRKEREKHRILRDTYTIQAQEKIAYAELQLQQQKRAI